MVHEVLDGEFKSEVTKLLATVIEKIDGLAKGAEINALKVDGLASDVRTNSFKLDRVDNRLENVEINLSGLTLRVENLEGGVKELTGEVRLLNAQFGDALGLSFRNEDRIKILETRVDGLDARVH